MANAIPVGHYSQLGEQTIRSMAENDTEYIKFLKYFGRVFKHPVSVALEFYVNRPEAQFIASGNQWEKAGYHIETGSKGIQFLDQKGNVVTLYDFDDVLEDYPPKRWTITNKNVDSIRAELNLSKEQPLFIALDESAASAIDDLSLIQDLGLTELSNDDKLKFRDSYHNMIQMMITGRLEINGARYNIQPDRSALEFCQTDEQRLILLTSASSAARKALTSVEYAFDSLRTQNSILREGAQNYDELRSVESPQYGRKNENSGSRISSDTERKAPERSNGSLSGDERQPDRLDNNSGVQGDENPEMASGDSNRNEESRRSDDRAAISPEPDERTLRTDDNQRTDNGGAASGNIRQNVDGEYGEKLSGEDRIDVTQPQLSDSSSVGRPESDRISGAAERSVRQEQSSSDRLRSNSEMGTDEKVRNRPLDNDGDNSVSSNNALNSDYTSYAQYRASLRNTRFTRLNETQKFNYAHNGYVENPTTSIWGEVDGVVRINNGIFEVTTPSHGGIMIKAEIAKTIMSKEAQRVAQKANGWYFYEEDCDYTVAKRELLDKGLFSDIDYYFSRQYNKKIDEFIVEYNEAINGSIQRWNSKYWDSREIALFNALSPEEQAEEIGQLSFDDDTAATADEAEVSEIRNHAIEKTIEDVRKRIERIEASNGDPDELRTQVNMLNFLQTAVESGVEITAENFKSYMADNVVDTSINDIADYSRNYFEIYQLKNDEELRYHRFTDYETLIEAGNAVEAKNYRKVYEDSLTDGTTLEDIYTRFNIAQPEDFTGHSLSVSDIIVVHDNGDTAAYYVDDIGYKRVPEFLQLEHKAENVEISSNEETAVDTSSNDNEQAIHDGFANLYANHNFTPKQKQFLERLERFSARNNVTENIIDEAFEKAAAFHNHYGNRMYVSRNTFSWRLNSIEKELVEAIQRNFAKTSVNEPITLDDVVAQFFHSGSSSVESVNGTWTINLCDDDKYAEVFHNGKAACAIYLADDKFTVRPYEELSAIPAMVTKAMKANITDSSVELLEYDRTFETPLEKAQYLINTFCESEYGDEADFSNMSSIGIAYTTITDDELPVQVTADLTNYKITYEFDGEVYSTEQYDSLEAMVDSGLTGLNFDELISVPDDIIEKHTQNTADTERNKEAYMLLSRCSKDCEYIITNGEMINSLTSLNKHLYGGSVDICINTMRDLYNNLPDSEKPEWLSKEDIDSYEDQLNKLVQQLDRQPIKPGSQALISAEINGEVHNYKFTGKTVNDIMSIAKTATPLLGYDNIGSRINEVEYAEIQQSDDFTLSVELNFDNDTVSIYSVNDGQGGLSEGDRTEDSILIEEFKISEYRMPNTGLAAEKVVIDTDNAYSMWENGFTVYADNVAIQEHNDNYDKSLEIAEIFKEEKVFTAEFGDVKQQEMIDAISGEIDDLDAAMPEDNYIDIRDFVDYDEDNVFDWNNGQNVYLNITKALIERNFGFIDDYLTAVKNEYDSIRAEMAQDSLVEYANYTPPTKEYNTVIDIPEYGLSIDLLKIGELVLNDTYSEYEGGTDYNGHEMRDNYSQKTREISISLNAYGAALLEGNMDGDEWSPVTQRFYDLSDHNEVTALKDDLTKFISNSEELNVYSRTGGETEYYKIGQTDTNINLEADVIPSEVRNKAKKTLIVNLYGGPGAGKSTTALMLAAELKKQGLHAEYVSEVAKELVYAQAFDRLDGSLENQKQIFTEQKNRLDMIAGNVDVAVTDAPLTLNTIYLADKDEKYIADIYEQYNEYNNYNIVIRRDTSVPFEVEGRIHDFAQSLEKDKEILSMLETNNIDFEQFERDSIKDMAAKIIQKLSPEKTDTNISPAQSENEVADITDIEDLTSELNATTLADVEVGDILLLREPENGEAMYFRIDSMTDNFMVSMTRVKDESGSDFTEIGLSTKSIINGRWKETLLDENDDFPIIRYTKNYQNELNSARSDKALIELPEYGISVNLKKVKSFVVEDTNYLKNNDTKCRMLVTSLKSDVVVNAKIITEGLSEHTSFNFDLKNGNDTQALKNLLSDFINNAGDLNIYSTTQDDEVYETFDITTKEANVDTSINEEITAVGTSSNEAQERSHKRASRAEMLYREFTEAYPDMANGTHTYERYGNSYDEYGDNDAFEPLSLEYLGGDTYSFMTWYIQNGDLMRDPDFVFTLDHENKELHVLEFQMDGVPRVGSLYQSVILEDGTVDKQLQASLEENFRFNLRNAIYADRKITAYKDSNGEEYDFEQLDEAEQIIERPDIDDDSAYYRERLNAFSIKHGLGELNVSPNDNGFHITEKFMDGNSSPIWHISKNYVNKPLTDEELEEELTAFEAAAERNHTNVADYGYRQERLKKHGGISELPVVQEDLPEIRYADKPEAKIRDNITAIKEVNRIEAYEKRGEYPFEAGRNDYNGVEAAMARLRSYSGWGGVSQVFDERFPTMKHFREQLKTLLTPEEYAAARSSTLTSHYTPQVIIDEMYKTIRNMGLPENSRILEPSCGTGNFISRMPHDMGKGGIVGVELDPITAKIAKHLNVPKKDPYAEKENQALEETRDIKILNCGFEHSNLENNSFDVVIGNVPFGDFKLNDPDYTQDWLIHDAFFRKALDKVAPGGVVAFITSSGTLDKKNPKIREQLAINADLIGAVRLPNNAFADADTKVTSDIIFLQKRKTPLNVYDPKPDWCYTSPIEVEMVGKKYEGEKRTAYINSYFANNPQMVLGTIKQTTHFDMLTCEPIENKSLKEQLDTAFRQLNAKISIEKRERSNLEKKGYIEPWGKSFTYQVKDDKVLYNLGNAMEEVEGSKKKLDKLKALCNLRDITRELLTKQQTYANDSELIPLRNKLNEAYDEYVSKNGHITDKSNKRLFSIDADYPILSALEVINPETREVTKADIFSRRTVNPISEVTTVETAEEAMQVSLDKKGRVDIPYMAALLQNKYNGMELSEIMENVTDELLDKGLIFRDPEKLATGKPYVEIVDKSEYLCGNVRRKLVMAEDAASQDSSYDKNVEALKEVIPEDIGASEIIADIGCTWIDTDDYEVFMRELSGRTEYDSRNFSVRFSEITGKFSIENAHIRNSSSLNTNEISTYGTEDMNMYHIMENLLNQKKIQVFDYFPDPTDPKKIKSVLNKNKTQVAQSRAKAIKQKFSEWIFAAEDRKEKYVKRYNEKFNNLVGRSYDGSHLTFSGMSNSFRLRPHQLDCVARSIYGGNTLAAHCVGAGKSAVIAASTMKKKELGLIHKACIVVPKPLTEQTEREWRTSFPDAKLLVVDNKDLSDEKKRELFTARVATGDYDAIIMSQEQFEKLPMSARHQLEFLTKQCAEMQDQLTQCKRDTGRRDPTVKELEQAIKKIQNRIENIANPKSKSRGKDTLLSFEALGFDYLVVDEAHAYKNGFVMTKMGDVSGVNTRESGRSGDMQMKCDYFNSEFGNGHILFATGTPVSNSMTELYVMTRYLRPDLLEDCGCSRFDDWAATFGQIKTQNKKTATGELKLKTCFAGFKNRPELIKMYKEFADLRRLDQLDYLNPPKIKGGKPQIVEVEATPEQREIVKDFARRGRDIQLGNVRPDEDNLLKITGEARLVGLGNQAVASVYEKNGWELPDGFLKEDKSGKIDKCIENVVDIYKEKYDTKSVQIIFSDIAVNSDDGKFSAYEYIKDELIKQGVKEDEIIFAPKSDAKNRADIFRDINEAKYRVVIASTGTLGTGANIQKNLYALHHLDIPWRPSDFEQREGRIVRQGNLNDEVEIFNYVTKGTLDSYLYQGVTDKARGIAQLWNDNCISRTSEDIDEKVLTFGELEAAAEGNPKLREYSEMKNRIDELQVIRAEYNRETTKIERSLQELPDKIEAKKSLVAAAKNDLKAAKKMQTNGKIEMIKLTAHNDKTLTDRSKINSYLAEKIKLRISNPHAENTAFHIGNFKISVETTTDIQHPAFVIKGERAAAYRIEVGVGDNSDNCQRLMNFLDKGIEKQIEKDIQSIEKMSLDLEQAQERVEAKFPNEDEYHETLKALEELEAELTTGGYLDNGEEIASVEDYGDYETERLEANADYDEDDLTPEEYNRL